LKKTKVVASPVPSAAKAGNYDQYHEVLDRHKQKMADGERNMDEWNKSMCKNIKFYFKNLLF
jgi:hypothetical protein